MNRYAALAALALVASAPAQAGDLRADLTALQALDSRVQTAGWRLARGNAPFCTKAGPGIGLQLLDTAGFADPAAVRSALGLTGDIAVAAVAANGPAARAGLTAGQTLSDIAGLSATALPTAKPGDFARLVTLHDAVDAQLAASGQTGLADAAGRPIVVPGEIVCLTRFEMLTKGSRASADGQRVTIGRKLVESLADDELLAAALAHELAHNLLGHRARLDASGRSWGKVKATEREADRLMPWLLANAGYEPSAAVRFFEHWGPKFDPGIFATPDHDGWKERVRRVRAELAEVAGRRAENGKADWTRVFATDERRR